MKAPVLILGATGGVGHGLVAAAVASGRAVIAVARDKDGLQRLQASHPGADIAVLPGSIATDAQGARLARALRKRGQPLGGVIVAVCGDRRRGRLLEQPAQSLRQTLDDDLLPHLIAARHLLPLLTENDRSSHQRAGYVLIGGPGSEQPWAGYGHRSVGMAALRMLARVLHDEARTHALRVQLLLVDTPIRTDSNDAHACARWPSAIAVGQRALALLDHSDAVEPRAIVRYSAPRTPPSRARNQDTNQDTDMQRCLTDARALIDSLQFLPHPEDSRK